MKVTLLMKRRHPSTLFYYEETVSTEYTGRWKIEKTNGESTLFLECFDFVEKEVEVPVFAVKTNRTIMRGFFWWQEPIPLPDVVRQMGVIKRNILSVKNIGWVSENKLDIEVVEEFINTCGETNG